METRQVLDIVEVLLDETNVAVMATTDPEGCPCVRWMTPTIIRDRPGTIFALTASGWDKVCDIRNHPMVEWMFQNRGLTKVVNIRGKINVLDNPQIKNEVIEKVGHKLTSFWTLNMEPDNLVVLETVIEQAEVLESTSAHKTLVKFK
jgi:general stress protein 26